MRSESNMRRVKNISFPIVLAAFYLGLGVAAGAQVSSPVQTIQGAKKQLNQATSGQKAQAPVKPQAAPPPTSQLRPPAKQSSAAPAKAKAPAKTPATPSANAQAKAPAKAQAKGPAKEPSKAPAAASAKTPAKGPAKASAAAQGKPAAKSPAKAAAAKGKPAAPAEAPKVARRDPFSPLLSKQRAGGPAPENLPPGKAGLVIATLRLQGIVRGPNGMIAVVANPQQSVYFLREGDQLYDGRVLHISMEAVSFHESGKDAFGKPVERQVTKRLYPSAGE